MRWRAAPSSAPRLIDDMTSICPSHSQTQSRILPVCKKGPSSLAKIPPRAWPETWARRRRWRWKDNEKGIKTVVRPEKKIYCITLGGMRDDVPLVGVPAVHVLACLWAWHSEIIIHTTQKAKEPTKFAVVLMTQVFRRTENLLCSKLKSLMPKYIICKLIRQWLTIT